MIQIININRVFNIFNNVCQDTLLYRYRLYAVQKVMNPKDLHLLDSMGTLGEIGRAGELPSLASEAVERVVDELLQRASSNKVDGKVSHAPPPPPPDPPTPVCHHI